MKKLLIAIAAAATAVGAYAEGAVWQTGTSFSTETQLEAAQPLSSTTIQELDAGAGYWSTNLPDTVQVSLFAGGAPAPMQRFIDADFAHENYLSVKTTLGQPIWRNVLSGGTAKTVDANTAVYFEGNVKFTAFDSVPNLNDDDYAGAKIALYVQDLTEAETNPQAATNLYVAIGSDIYACGDASALVDNWAKLTIKAMQINDDGQLGFIIYVNGVEITADDVAFPEDMTAVAKVYAQQKKLFPSAIASGAAMSTLTAIGFDGQGALDQIAFTDEDLYPNPNCFTISWDETITSVALDHGTTLAEPAVNGGAYAFGQETWKYTYIAADGYISVITPTEIEGDLVLTADPLAATVKIDGGEAENCSTIAAALTKIKNAISSAELALGGNVADGLLIEAGEEVTVTIDLAGKTVTGKSGDMAAICAVSGIVTVTNSTDDIGTVNIGDADAAIDVDDGEIYVQAGIYNGAVYANGITGGAFDVASNSKKDGSCSLIPPTGYEFVKDEETGLYWVLQEVVPTAVVTISAGANVTLTVVDGDGTTITTGDAVEVGTVLTITAAADTDYKLTSLTVNGDAFTSGENYVVVAADVEGGVTIAATAEAKVYVAQIGDDKYETLASAIAAINNGTGGDTLLFNTNIAATAADQILITKNATIDFNGKTFSIADSLLEEKKFGVDTGATVTFTNGVVELGTGELAKSGQGTGRSIAIMGTLNVECTMERYGYASPLFDIYGGTVNVGASANLTSVADVFRCKEIDLTSHVTVVEGAQILAKGGNGCSMFYNYKNGHKLVADLQGGQFSKTSDNPNKTSAGFFGDETANGGVEIWDVTISATAKFNTNEKFEINQAVGKIIPAGKELTLVEGWYMLRDAAQPLPPEQPIAKPDDKTIGDFVDEVNGNKAKYLAAPYGETTEAYLNLFTAVPNTEGTGVTMELTAKAKEDLEALADTAAATALADDTLTIAEPVAGLYYSLNEGATLEGMKTLEANANKTADGKAITFSPDKSGDAGFWKVLVTPTQVTPDVVE